MNKEYSTDAKQRYSTYQSFPPEHFRRHTLDNTMSCLSPIPECSDYRLNYSGDHASRSSHQQQQPPSHRRGISAFSSLAELKVQQKVLQQTKPIHFTVGGSVRSECVMTAVPESHFVRKCRGPNEKDMELLGLTLPQIRDPHPLHHEQNKSRFEIRDEGARAIFVCDQRTDLSAEIPNDEFHEEEDEDDDERQPPGTNVSIQESSTCVGHIEDHALAHESTTHHGKHKFLAISLKKPLQKIARKVWRRVKPMLCHTRHVFQKKKVPELQRAKGFLT